MACSCGKKAGGTITTYKVALPGGRVKVYSSQEAAQAEAKRVPGAYVIPRTDPALV